MRPELIIVKIEQWPDGDFYAGSPDLKGLHMLEKSREAIVAKAPEVIALMMQAMKKDVTVAAVDSPSDEFLIYVTVPARGELNLCA